MPDLVPPLRPCCGKTRQSKSHLSILIVQSRVSGNLLSSLFIYLGGSILATSLDAVEGKLFELWKGKVTEAVMALHGHPWLLWSEVMGQR